MTPEILNAIEQALSSGKRGVLCTVIEKDGSTPCNTGSKMWVNPDGSIIGTVGGGTTEHMVKREALNILSGTEGSRLIKGAFSSESVSDDASLCGGNTSIYLEVIGNRNEIVIFGAGHVGKAIALAADLCGFPVLVWDDREEYANSDNIPVGKKICCPLRECKEHIELHHGSYVIVCTRGHSLDGAVLEMIQNIKTAYVGMLASTRKTEQLRRKLISRGVSMEFLDSIHTPVGLPVNADSPREIAVSVIAEIIAVKNGADLEVLSRRTGK